MSSRDMAYRLASQHRGLERMVDENRHREVLERDIIGVVVVHVDLFDDHLTLRVDLVLPEGGPLQHLGEDVESVPRS